MKNILPIIFACLLGSGAMAQKNLIKITGQTYAGDTVRLSVFEHYSGESKKPLYPIKELIAVAADGNFAFKVEEAGTVHCHLSFKANKKDLRIFNYLFSAGDSVHIRQKEYKDLLFSGRGSEKLTARYRMDSVGFVLFGKYASAKGSYEKQRMNSPLHNLLVRIIEADTVLSVQKKLLDDQQIRLGRKWYQLLYAGLIGRHISIRQAAVSQVKNLLPKSISRDSAVLITAQLNEMAERLMKPLRAPLSPEILSQSQEWLKATQTQVQHEASRHPSRNVYAIIDQRFQNPVRDQLMTLVLVNSTDNTKNPGEKIDSILPTIRTAYLKNALQSYRVRYLKGAQAYDFAMKDVNGKTRRLSDFRGKKVVIDFWFTGCGGCTDLYQTGLKAFEEKWRSDTSIVFISISMDRDKATWLRSVASDMYTSISAVNVYAGEAGFAHPVKAAYAISGYPTLVLIDTHGKILKNQGVADRTLEGLSAFIATD